jgi:murein L,D-transpeptidase YafK
MKNKLIYLMFLMIGNFCFSQTDELYKIIFENEENFRILKILNGKIPKKFILVDSTVTFYPKSFWLDINLKDEKVIKEIKEDEHHPYNNVYIFSQNEYNNLFSDDEKKYLSNVSENTKSKKIKITEKKYFTVDVTKKVKGFYFLISEPIFTSNNKFAFVEVDIKQKGTFLGEKTDDYFGVLKIIFEKDENGIWKQIGNYDHLIL